MISVETWENEVATSVDNNFGIFLRYRFKDIFQEVYETQGWKEKYDAAGIWWVPYVGNYTW